MLWFLLSISILLILVFLGMPVSFSIILASISVIIMSGAAPLNVLPIILFKEVNSFALIAIPLFMFTGAIMVRTGITSILIDFASSLVGWLRGGLAMINVVVSMFFAGMSGSITSDISSIGAILIPEMKRKGYPANFSAAITASSASIAAIIPPSISMIIYGVIANASIGRLFIAGLIPGVLAGIGQMLVSYVLAKKRNYPVHEDFDLRKSITRLRAALPPLLIPLIILGGILGGIFTPTEAASVAVFTVLILTKFVYKSLTWEIFIESLVSTAKIAAVVLLLISASGILSYFLSSMRIPAQIAETILGLTSNKILILLSINVFFLIIGCFIAASAAIVMLVPIFLPLVIQLGIDPVHFGIILTVNLVVGTMTPPVATGMLLSCLIAKTSVEDVWKAIKWLLLVMLIILLLVTYVPQVVMFLPGLLMG